MKRVVAGLAACALLLPQVALARDAELKLQRARIDRELKSFVASGRVVGAEVLIWKDGREQHYATAGLADRETARPFSRGEFFWGGYPSMLFWVDPANAMAVVFATQKVPFDGTLHHDIREAVYGPGYGAR